MQRQEIGLPVQIFEGIHLLHTVGFEHRRIRDEGVVGDDVHAQRLTLAPHEFAHIAVGVDAEGLALYLRTRTGRKAVARHEDHHGERQLGHGVGVLPRGIHHHDTARRGGREIHVVVTRTGTNHDFEVLRRPDDFGRHLVAADNERIDIGHGGQQLGLVGIFFKQGQFIARVLDDPADAVDSLLGKRLFGRN